MFRFKELCKHLNGQEIIAHQPLKSVSTNLKSAAKIERRNGSKQF